MNQPGVSVKPIKLISGLSPFCETFFEDARALKRNVVGKVNEGWTVAEAAAPIRAHDDWWGDGGSGGRPQVAALLKTTSAR